jgi:uncharacterized membrane protein
MPAAVNYWMGYTGLIYLVAGLLLLRKELAAARGREKLIALGPVFIAASLAVFAPEHFRGPQFVADMVPRWMPAHLFWAYFVGAALLAAATSLVLRKCVGLSSTLLGLMFFLFVALLYLPSAMRHPHGRFVWSYALRDLSFCAGAWALAGLHGVAAAPRPSRALIRFGRLVFAVAALFYAAEHFLHPEFAPGVPLELVSPSWVPFPRVLGYGAGAILLVAGLHLALNRKTRIAAAAIGALMTALTLGLYLPILVAAHVGSVDAVNDALNYVADTLLYGGAALALAAALPRDRAPEPAAS